MGINTKLSGLAIMLTATQAGAAPIGAFDQYTLELINGFRANPQAAANTHLSGNLNEGLAPGTISAAAKQPLAWNQNIVNAAQGHTADMINNNFFGHTGSDSRSPGERLTAAGYNWQTFGENLSTRGQTGLSDVTAAISEQMNTDLFIDSGVAGRGHRTSMLNNDFESVGISVGYSPSFSPLNGLPSSVATINFGANSDGAFLTGVAYDDGDQNDFYTPGEGLAGLDVVAFAAGTMNEVASTTTLAAGGYTLDLGMGTYDLEITGGLGRLFLEDIVLGDENVKVDYTNTTVATNPDPTNPNPTDPAVVPVPAAAWLFATGLLGFASISKRRVNL